MTKDSIESKLKKSIEQVRAGAPANRAKAEPPVGIERQSVSGFFTPLNEALTERLKFDRKDIEVLHGSLEERERGYVALIKVNGRTYQVFGMDCDSTNNCTCDSYIKGVV